MLLFGSWTALKRGRIADKEIRSCAEQNAQAEAGPLMLMVRRANMGLSIAAGGQKRKGLHIGPRCSCGFHQTRQFIAGWREFHERIACRSFGRAEGASEARRPEQRDFLEAVQGLPVFSGEIASLLGGPGPEVLVRLLDIRTLAERVFGDAEKAEAWLTRSNSSLSGQRPLDLLKDELGTAVVREMLERIDHGIFA